MLQEMGNPFSERRSPDIEIAAARIGNYNNMLGTLKIYVGAADNMLGNLEVIEIYYNDIATDSMRGCLEIRDNNI